METIHRSSTCTIFNASFIRRWAAVKWSPPTLLLGCVLIIGSGWSTDNRLLATEAQPSPQQLTFFETKVRPLLAEHCYQCHSTSAEKLQAGLRMDSRLGLLEGGDSGAAIAPGDVDDSLIVTAVRYESYEMPPSGKLADDEIRIIEQWIEMGAPWPQEDDPASSAAATSPGFDVQQRREEHWCWQPIAAPTPPDVHAADWPRDPLDRFILSGLEAAGLQPAPDTDRETLMRRLYLDLIGLPPTTEQADRFLSNESADAVEELVDELLANEHFGERWARHWLDLVRYAESRGHEFDNDTPNAFQYRDYLIRAFNADVPYDQFVREHIAGDLLDTPRLHPEQGFNESILGTGFWFLGEWVHSPVDIRKDESDRFDNMIDVMSKTFLGVTVACARCHDHKFDAISTADYYSLSGFLQSSDYRQVRFESIAHNREIAAELDALDSRYRALLTEMIASDKEGGLPVNRGLGEASAASSEPLPGVVVDYETLADVEYRQDGYIFGPRPRRAGQFYLGSADGGPTLEIATGTVAASDPFWHGLESISLGGVKDGNQLAKIPQSGRTLLTPTFELEAGKLAIRVQGRGHVFASVDSHRLVSGPLHREVIREIKEGEEWGEMDMTRYIGHRIHLEFTPAEDAVLAVSHVMVGASAEVREQIDRQMQQTAESISEYAAAVKDALAGELQGLLADWAEERAALRSRVMWRSHLAIAMIDATSEDDRILIRGNSSRPGEIEPRHFLTAVSGEKAMDLPNGSGRLQLADEINDRDNPLTTRVIVNRLWHHLMGRGIVPTTDDFGVLGQHPTHPELLDYLASEFVRDGQSMQRMIRRIVLSRTYQMSSQSDEAAMQTDPTNRLWHHRPLRRLQGEVIRDSLLVLSGRLDPTMFGPPVPIHLTEFMDGRGKPGNSGPLDGANRRSIYTAVRRNFLSPFMITFDSPTPFSTMGRRNVSNVPAQALILMNDPMVIDQARSWAERAIKDIPDPQARIDWMFRAALARPATEPEREVARRYIEAQTESRGSDSHAVEIWADLAHSIINIKEFIFIP